MAGDAIQALGLSDESCKALRQGAWNVFELAHLAWVQAVLPTGHALPKEAYYEQQKLLGTQPRAGLLGFIDDLAYRIAAGEDVADYEWRAFKQIVSDASRGYMEGREKYEVSDIFRLVCMEMVTRNSAIFDGGVGPSGVMPEQFETMKQSHRGLGAKFLYEAPRIAAEAIETARRPRASHQQRDNGPAPTGG